MEDPDGVEVMIGGIQVNEEVELPWSGISATDFDDWQQTEHVWKLIDQCEFISIHRVPSSEVVTKGVITTRWVL